MTARMFFLVVSPMLLLAAGLGFLAAEARARPAAPTIFWSDDIVREMRGLVERTYVDEVPPEQAKALFYAACKGYLSGLDSYCEFYTPEEKRAMEQDTQGEFGGVGILGNPTKDGILVRGARIGDPAWQAGIRAGDLLVSIDGADARGDKSREVLRRLRGEPETAVRVAWTKREGKERREASIVRSKVKMDSVIGVSLLDAKAGIGYLRISRFQEHTAADLKAGLRKLKDLGARSYVLDLRSDFGGVLPAAVSCADCFLSEGVVVVTRDRNGIEKPRPRAGGADPRAAFSDADDLLDPPLIVLVDGGTASASEILAGALQDYRRAVLVGERTYGKFLVQRIVPIEVKDGEESSDVAVKITTARYYTPFGRNLQRDDSRGVRGGIVPDVPVAVTEAQRRVIEAGFESQTGLDWDILPEESAAGAAAIDDPILARALTLLQDADDLRAEKK